MSGCGGRIILIRICIAPGELQDDREELQPPSLGKCGVDVGFTSYSRALGVIYAVKLCLEVLVLVRKPETPSRRHRDHIRVYLAGEGRQSCQGTHQKRRWMPCRKAERAIELIRDADVYAGWIRGEGAAGLGDAGSERIAGHVAACDEDI